MGTGGRLGSNDCHGEIKATPSDIMELTPKLNATGPLADMATAVLPAESLLHVTVVYEDAATRQWAGEVFERVTKLVGKDAIRSTWWKMGDLSQPAVLAGAVSTAI